MPTEIFLMPLKGSGIPFSGDGWRPKYADDPAVTAYALITYDNTKEPAIVKLEASQAYLDSVAGEADVLRLATEDNIDTVLTAGQANAAITAFEDAFIPRNFIKAGMTRRQVLRTIIGLFMFSHRIAERFGVGWKDRARSRGMTLNSTWSEFPQALKTELVDIRDEYGWGNLGINASTTMREMLELIAAKYAQTDMYLGMKI